MPRCAAVLIAVCLAACDGPQSALAPAGAGAKRIADLFWSMTAFGTLIWLLVIGLAVYATQFGRGAHNRRATVWLVIGGGVVFPVVVLAVLLSYGLYLLQPPRVPSDALRLEVVGEQWWWRVRYLPQGGEPIELANEIRLPVGQSVELHLRSADVIHSLWIPPLGGKVDMIPGRTTRMVLEPQRSGSFRGACAEYCGTSHALMALAVVVMEPAAFEEWLQQQAAAAQPPPDAAAERGQQLFLANGCGGCHRIRGTPATGVIGPDLTHVGSRQTLGAGILPNDAATFQRWIGHTGTIKPEVRMPAFDMLPPEDLASIATYLSGLR